MQMASVLAGFSMTQADHLRRAMSKKNPVEMDKMRKAFVEGCAQASKIREDAANKLFDLIDYFSGYGFNKSHSAAYAFISYHTAYLKANFPVEFMCALLTSEKDNTDKVVEYVKESQVMGLRMLPPDVNHSITQFSVVDEKSIRFGLLAVKNVGETAIESIVARRKDGGPFESIFDFCSRVDLRLCNHKVLESLIKCGAMDCFKASRPQLMAVLDQALDEGSQGQREKAAGQFSFFDMDAGTGFQKSQKEYPEVKDWSQTQVLAFEKEALGFYVSGHPLAHFKVEIKEFADYSSGRLKLAKDGQEVKVVGLLNVVKLTTTKKTNERMAICKLEDLDGEVEVLIFPSSYPAVASYLKEGGVVLVRGRVSLREDAPKIVVTELKPIDEVYKNIKSINVDLSHVGEEGLKDLKQKLANHPGRTPVYLSLDTKAYKSVQILVGEDLFVSPNEGLLEEIKELVGEDRFSLKI